MTENRKRICVEISGVQRAAQIRAPVQAVARSVRVDAETRGRASVTIAAQQRRAVIRAPVDVIRAEVSVDAIPVRVVDIVPRYGGEYTVEPDFSGQTLPTRGKKMVRDLTVNPIYIAETSNPAGGVTVYIGG